MKSETQFSSIGEMYKNFVEKYKNLHGESPATNSEYFGDWGFYAEITPEDGGFVLKKDREKITSSTGTHCRAFYIHSAKKENLIKRLTGKKLAKKYNVTIIPGRQFRYATYDGNNELRCYKTRKQIEESFTI